MAGAHRPDRLVGKSACEAESLSPGFRARCAQFSASTGHPGSSALEHDLVAGLVRVLDSTLRALGDQGEEDLACRLAAQAWALLDSARPAEARRLNGTLHYLTRPLRNARQAGGAPSPVREARRLA